MKVYNLLYFYFNHPCSESHQSHSVTREKGPAIFNYTGAIFLAL